MVSVLEHWADQDKPAGSNPPTSGDLDHPTRRDHQPQRTAHRRQNFQDAVMTCGGNDRETGVPDSGTPESGHAKVISVVNVCKNAKSLADHPKLKAKMDEIFKIYGDLLAGKPCKNPPVRGAFREATIPTEQAYRP